MIFHCFIVVCIDLPLSGPFVQAFHSLDIPLILHFPSFSYLPTTFDWTAFYFPNTSVRFLPSLHHLFYNPYLFFSNFSSFSLPLYLYSNATTSAFQCPPPMFCSVLQTSFYCANLHKTAFSYCNSLLYFLQPLFSLFIKFIKFLIFNWSCFIQCCNYAHTYTFSIFIAMSKFILAPNPLFSFIFELWKKLTLNKTENTKLIDAYTCAVQHCLWGPGKVLVGCHSNPDHQQNARCLKTYCWRHWVSSPSLHGPSHSTVFPWCLLVSERADKQGTEGIFNLLNFTFHEKGIILSILQSKKCFW